MRETIECLRSIFTGARNKCTRSVRWRPDTRIRVGGVWTRTRVSAAQHADDRSPGIAVPWRVQTRSRRGRASRGVGRSLPVRPRTQLLSWRCTAPARPRRNVQRLRPWRPLLARTGGRQPELLDQFRRGSAPTRGCQSRLRRGRAANQDLWFGERCEVRYRNEAENLIVVARAGSSPPDHVTLPPSTTSTPLVIGIAVAALVQSGLLSTAEVVRPCSRRCRAAAETGPAAPRTAPSLTLTRSAFRSGAGASCLSLPPRRPADVNRTPVRRRPFRQLIDGRVC